MNSNRVAKEVVAVDRANQRWPWAVAVVAAIVIGLASRRFRFLFPSALGKYPGDTFWSMMVFFGWRCLLHQNRLRIITGVSVLTCVGIELEVL